MTDDLEELVWLELGQENGWDGRSIVLDVPGKGSMFIPSSELVVAEGTVWWPIDEALADELRAAWGVNDDR